MLVLGPTEIASLWKISSTVVPVSFFTSDSNFFSLSRNKTASNNAMTVGICRFLFCSIKIIRDLERIGDHLTTVAKKGYRVSTNIPDQLIEKLEVLGGKASVMTHDALNCLFDRKLADADKIAERDNIIDDLLLLSKIEEFL